MSRDRKGNSNVLYSNYSLEIFIESFDHVLIKVELWVPPKVLLSYRERHLIYSKTTCMSSN
jgi:hypothetical protein